MAIRPLAEIEEESRNEAFEKALAETESIIRNQLNNG